MVIIGIKNKDNVKIITSNEKNLIGKTFKLDKEQIQEKDTFYMIKINEDEKTCSLIKKTVE